MSRPSRRSPGFTLIELLVVIAIIGVLVGLLLPAVQKVREAANRAKCVNNMKQVALALHHYHDAKKNFPEALDNRFHVHWHWSWLTKILPFVEQNNLWDQAETFANNKSIPVKWAGIPGYAHWSPWGGWVFGLSEPGQNPALGTLVRTYTCPSDTQPRRANVTTYFGTPLDLAYTDYLGVSGRDYTTRDGCLFSNDTVRIPDIRDGASNTLLVGERATPPSLRFGTWMGGCGQYATGLPPGDEQRGSGDITLGVRERNSQSNGYADMDTCPRGPYHFQPPNQIKNGTGQVSAECDYFHFWSYHPGGANFAFADGSVRFLAYSADSVMPALGTRMGGETVSLP